MRFKEVFQINTRCNMNKRNGKGIKVLERLFVPDFKAILWDKGTITESIQLSFLDML